MKQSWHLKPRRKGSRTQLVASMEAAARRLSRYAEHAECDLGEVGASMSLRAFAVGLRELADMMGERRMTIRPGLRHKARRRQQDSIAGDGA
jgi:hypothetical protein